MDNFSLLFYGFKDNNYTFTNYLFDNYWNSKNFQVEYNVRDFFLSARFKIHSYGFSNEKVTKRIKFQKNNLAFYSTGFSVKHWKFYLQDPSFFPSSLTFSNNTIFQYSREILCTYDNDSENKTDAPEINDEKINLRNLFIEIVYDSICEKYKNISPDIKDTIFVEIENYIDDYYDFDKTSVPPSYAEEFKHQNEAVIKEIKSALAPKIDAIISVDMKVNENENLFYEKIKNDILSKASDLFNHFTLRQEEIKENVLEKIEEYKIDREYHFCTSVGEVKDDIIEKIKDAIQRKESCNVFQRLMDNSFLEICNDIKVFDPNTIKLIRDYLDLEKSNFVYLKKKNLLVKMKRVKMLL